jgi:hypothetical protein
MLAARCRDRGATAVADRDASPIAILAMASGDAIAITDAVADAITATITIANAIADAVPTTITVPTTDSSAAAGSRTATSARTAPTSAATATMRQCRAGCQGNNHRSEHEHSESSHVAPPPETISVTPG